MENRGNLDYNFTFEGNDASELSIHISDVLAVIQENDPAFAGQDFEMNNLPTLNGHSPNLLQSPLQQQEPPYVVILEEPASKALRFRYECEGRSAGSIPGANSTADNKTFPTIQIKNYHGRAVVVVSCVTKDKPYKAHPHNLVGKEGCKKGVCTLEINTDDMKMVFSNLGIQCVKRRDIDEALRVREEIRVDPFRSGYTHRSQPSTIDLNAVRLCFQVFLEGSTKGRFTLPLKPVVSQPIFDKKSMSDLVITKLSHCNAFCNGGQEMILLCEKVAKEDIQVRFYEDEKDGSWEGLGEFQHSQVHKQVAISFRTPRYKNIDILEPVRVKIQLRRPSDGVSSEPLEFEMLPLNEEQTVIRRKRQRSSDDPALNFLKQSPGHDGRFIAINDPSSVKLEPREQSTSPYGAPVYGGNYRIPQTTPSPQPVSPPMFAQNCPSPLPMNNNQIGTILKAQLQAPVIQQTNNNNANFQQQPHTNQIYQPNIQPAPASFNITDNTSVPWTNNISVPVPSTSRANIFNNEMISSLFNQPMSGWPPMNIVATNVNISNNEPRTNISSLMDLDTQQMLNNLSGDLNNLSFSDIAMERSDNIK